MTKTRDLADLGGGFIQAGTGAVQRTVESKLQDVVSVKDFGAVGDGVADDTAAIQAALDTGKQVYIPHTASGYLLNATLIFNAGATLVGARSDTTLKAGASLNNSWFLEVRGSNVTINNVQLSAVGLVNGTGGVRFRTDLAAFENTKIQNLTTVACNYGVKDEAHASNKLVALQLRECRFRQHRGPGIVLVKAFAYITFTDVVVDYVGSSSQNHTAYSFTGNEGMFLTNVDVTGGTVDGTTGDQHGFVFNDCIACWLTNCMADTVGGNGFTFTNQTWFCYLTNCVSSLCGKYGFKVDTSCKGLMFNGCNASGRLGQSYAPTIQHGFYLQNSDELQLTNCKSREHTGTGYFLDGGVNAVLVNCSAHTCTGRAVDSTGSNVGSFTALNIISCSAGNINFSSGNMYAYGPIYNSGGSVINFNGPGSV